MTNKAQVDEALEFAAAVPGNVVEYVLKNHANGDSWKTILVVYNGNKQARDLAVMGDWSIVANDKAAGTATLARAKNKIHVAPFSLVVAHSEGAYQIKGER
jgi:pullulanase